MRLLRLLTEPERRSRKGGQGETCNELPARGARWRREVAPLLAGFVLSPCGGPPPQVTPADAGQGELFGAEFSQPDATDGEPVFWSAGSAQASPKDDFLQADPAESL